MWNREQAFKVIEKIEPGLASLGAHCGITGSVAFVGESEKDLDIIVYPHKVVKGVDFDFAPIKAFISATFENRTISDCGGVSKLRDDKKISWLETESGKRIDFFFMQ